jgi:hypothetical protein
MGMLAIALVLAIEDAQEMFQRSNVLYVYVHVYACWGVWTKSRVFSCYGRRLPLERRWKGTRNSSSRTQAVKMTIADILDVPCGCSVTTPSEDSDIDQKVVSVLIGLELSST